MNIEFAQRLLQRVRTAKTVDELVAVEASVDPQSRYGRLVMKAIDLALERLAREAA